MDDSKMTSILKMPQTIFFALKDDLLPVFEAAERQGPLQYVLSGAFPSSNVSIFDHGWDIPTLGKATFESASGSDSYLVCEVGTQVIVRHRESDGHNRFFVDQVLNPDSITLSPGGMWDEDVMLYGRVASASDSEISLHLLRRFDLAIRKHFLKVGRSYVGPRALELLKMGKRLTIAKQSPPEFDLKLP
jgi:hypothetical protein